jgi:hypothetical protein
VSSGSAAWQVRFDGGHQQRYLPDRTAVLRYILAVGPRAASPRFEVFAEADPVQMKGTGPGGTGGGSPPFEEGAGGGSFGGRRFELVEVIDLAADGEVDRLRAELGLS